MWMVFAPGLFSQTLDVYSEFARIDGTGAVTAPAEPREILSPMLVRNGYTSFQIVVHAESGPWVLFVPQNPKEAVKVTVYRESGERLEPVELPFTSKGTAVIWLDLWCDRAAPVRRVKVEPEIWSQAGWNTYPMEVRVVEATVPDDVRAAVADLREFLCGERAADSDVERMHVRNARQDAALAARISTGELRRAGGCSAEDPESYLRIRDSLFRLR
jgi:hypothetical protein